MNELGKRISKKCEELKITPKDLALFAEMKYSTLNSMMNADVPNPTLQNMKKLSIALGTSLDSLVFDENLEEDEEMGIILKELKTIRSNDKKRILYMIRMMIAESKQKA